MPVMAKNPKKPKPAKPDPHRMPQFQLRMHQEYLDALEKLSERNRTSMTEEARRGIREYLQREGLWPPS